MIYVIRDTLSGHVKIGLSGAPWVRFAKMRVDCPGDLFLRAILPGERADEQALHRRFAAQRLRGEWFRAEGPLAEWIVGLPLAVKPASNYRNTWGDSALTDEMLAPVVGISRGHICKIRRGKCMPSLGVAFKIAEATGVDIRSLMHPQPTRADRAA